MKAPTACLLAGYLAAGLGASLAAEPAQTSRSGPESRMAGKPEPKDKASALKVGRKRVPLSSQELDTYCNQVVAPFDIDVSAMTLAKWGAGEFVGSIGGIFGGRGQRTETKHRISRETREQAARMNWLPMSVERKYGRYLHGQAVENGDLVDRDSANGRKLYPVADALLSKVLKGVKEPHPYTFEVHIRKESTDNAQALPGGIVYLDAGLVKNRKRQAYASFALAHEIGHVLQRHETRIAQARIIDTLSLTASVKDLVNVVRDPGNLSEEVLAAAAGGHKSFRRHYEAQELQADACSVRILDTVVDSDEALVLAIKSFLDALPPDDPAAGSRPAGSAFEELIETVNNPIDRHPSTKDRTENLQVMLRTARRLPAR
jgi:hypothetical protein